MSKITLTNLVNLQNETTAVNTINANNVAITAAIDNTLSRDGTTPNQMGSNLDMNSYRVLNLPVATSNYEPLRVIDAATLNGGGTISVSAMPAGGTTGQALTKNSAVNYDAGWATITGSSSNYIPPYTGGSTRTVTSKLSDYVSVLDFGASNSGADSTAAFNAAFAGAHAVVIPPGTYALSGDIAIPSNTYIWVQKGATITNTGGRFTAAIAGGGNISFQIDGVMYFPATATGAQVLDWGVNAGVICRGLIEFGGTQAAPIDDCAVFGTGRVYSDYNYVGIPDGTALNFPYSLNRKGIAFFNSKNCVCEGLEIDHIHGEALYFNGFSSSYNIKFIRNYIHNVNFDALNFNVGQPYQGLLAAGNYVFGAFAGMELSGGTCDNNYFDNCHAGVIFGGGTGIGPLRVTNNAAVTCTTGYSLEFGTIVENIVVMGNQSINIGADAYVLGTMQGFQLKNNTSYGHATAAAGKSFTIKATCFKGHADGNLTLSAGGFSTGNFTNLAAGTVTIGTNPTP